MKIMIHNNYKYVTMMAPAESLKLFKSSFFTKALVSSMILCTLLSAVGCNKVLDQKPKNDVDESSAITDLKGAQAAVAGLYNQLQDQNYYGRNFIIMSDVSSDQAQSIGTWDFYREMDTYQVSLGNTENGYFYSRAYRTINVANNILKKVPALTVIPPATQNELQGAAYFVRALAYFDLTRVYGGIPTTPGVNSATAPGVAIVTTPTISPTDIVSPSRATLKASYDQVESDLLKALNLLPESADKSRSSKGAVKALLSRLYLYEGRYTESITYSDLVINDSKYTLNPSFTDIFLTKLSSEAIFELAFNDVDQSNLRYWYYPTSLGGRGDISAHASFRSKAIADSKDIRGTLYGFDASANVYYPTKYSKSGGLDNIQIIRVAEMYLNRAEAKAQRATGSDLIDAVADLNKIRNRAGASSLVPVGQQAILQAIWDEEILEFAFEGHSFFDYARTGQALTKLVNLPRKNSPTSVSLTIAGRQIFPIPSFEIDANKNIVQNEAYK
jgi:hypothetical protein